MKKKDTEKSFSRPLCVHLSKEPEQSKEAIIAEELRNGEMKRKKNTYTTHIHGNEEVDEKRQK